ncbi:hypothetical protein ACWDGI_42440 [Streptomyces sp. NPDC001220]|uniref:Uncharacterized protein n=1 Tax=Streptomyces sp. 900129855 TaxID=3155129 RepID=A0ABV2ZLJ5_9ACTN|nr:hypothetical protein [Streptomyces sp. MUM 2J]MCH0562170.1 hypothetical protein [Streptomyces sp. MUM 2J]WTB14995.1 hypothetical protein OG293_15810 [Streptomyces sp. NBC_00829]
MSEKKTAQQVMEQLSPDGVKLAKRVIELERENLHIRNSTRVVDEIVAAVKGLIK